MVTFALVAFQQEKFIGDAVKGAFSQTFSPLEIILSDDCSKDETFTTMVAAARCYRGPHVVRTNRNSTNLGLAAHINRVMEIARGELIVIAAGDDISLPHRCTTLWAAYEATGGKATSLFSTYRVIDDQGQESLSTPFPDNPKQISREEGSLLEYIKDMHPLVTGCTHAWARRLFDELGPLPPDIVFEDMALSFRTMAIGEMWSLNAPLVLYRRHSANASFHASDSDQLDKDDFAKRDAKELYIWEKYLAGYRAYAKDLQTLRSRARIDAEVFEKCSQAVAKQVSRYQNRIRFRKARWPGKFRHLGLMPVHGESLAFISKQVPRLLPDPLLWQLRAAVSR